ncbi:MAG: cation:proton antiporter subunit C [Dehalococcoidaceae bacterium]|nr:cation:proton antiporter subunit C [Dehalococcoidaceae bacterium]
MAELSFHYSYIMIVVLLVIGLYGMLGKRNLVKKVIGLNIFQTAIFLFFIKGALKDGATVPVIDPETGIEAAAYFNPLPHVMILTAIVVSVAITGVAMALLLNIYRSYDSLEEDVIMQRMGK